MPDAHAAGAAERPEAAGAAERPESAAKRKHQQMVATLKSTPANRDDLDVIPQEEPVVRVATRGPGLFSSPRNQRNSYRINFAQSIASILFICKNSQLEYTDIKGTRLYASGCLEA